MSDDAAQQAALQDPRHRNSYGEATGVGEYVASYANRLADGLKAVDEKALSAAIDAVEKTANGNGRVYVIGNGGSAAIGDHLCCDFTKGTAVDGSPTIRSHSLTANGALYTALANDFGFDEALSRQVEYYGEAGDLLIAVSSSGNSANIIAAVEAAKQLGIKVIGMSGFKGGALAEASDISLFVPVENYGIVEDSHQSLMHVIAQVVTMRREAKIDW